MLEQIYCLAGYFEPGDLTRYQMVAVVIHGAVEVIVLNDGFFDKISFVLSSGKFCGSFLGDKTNPWTIKAAHKFMEIFLERKNER